MVDTLLYIGGGGETLFQYKVLFISIVFEQKMFVLANMGGDRTSLPLPPTKCVPLFDY